MSLTNGELLSQARMRRLQSSIPSSYTVFKDGATYRAETNIAGGTDYSGTDALVVLQACIDVLTNDGGEILIKNDLNLGATGLNFTMVTDKHIALQGVGRPVITCSATKIIDVTNNSWTSGVLKLHNLYFSHNAPVNAIGLDLTYASCDLQRVLVKNTNAAKTDKIGIKLDPPTNAAVQNLFNVDSVGYGKGFYIGSDHVILLNCQASLTTQYAFGLMNNGICNALINPHVYLSAAEIDCDGYYFDNPGENISIFNPYYEPHSALGTHTAQMFFHTDNGNYVTHIYSPMIWKDAADFANILLSNNYTKLKFHGTIRRVSAAEDKRTENSGTSTGTGAQQTIAHGLATGLTPNLVTVVPTVTGATVTSVWADATNIYCTVTSGKAFKWSASLI